MKKITVILAVAALVAPSAAAFAEETVAPKNNFKFYGFVRNYFAFDTRESIAGTGDLYYWLPKDEAKNAEGVDMNAQSQFRFLSLTSRVGVDVSGYKINNVEFGGKIEADFYAGLTNGGGTAQLRLRQAFATVKWNKLGKEQKGSIAMKIGQAWHPMAADLPDIFSLESGAPFNAFSRTPLVQADFNLGCPFSITAAAIWQMQYMSMGPVWTKQADGTYSWVSTASTDFMKYGLTPELYLALNYQKGGFLGRIGATMLSIKPRHTGTVKGVTTNVKDRIITISPYIYLQYKKGLFTVKGKTILSSAGEHVNLMSGYAVCDMSDEANWKYTPIHTSSTWVTLSYGKKINGALLLGYMKNLGTSKDVIANGQYANASYIYYQKNGSCDINSMYRIQPEVTYNIGKFTVGLEYMLTAVQYGDKSTMSLRAISAKDKLHWVANNRIQAIVKFTF